MANSHYTTDQSPEDLRLHSLIAAHAQGTPEAVAIASPGRAHLTYGQLSAHIGGIAATLNSLGVGRNDRVAVVLPNGPEMAVAVVAVASCAACAPLDPRLTTDDFEFSLDNLNAGVLLVQSGQDSPARAVAQARGIKIIDLSPVTEAEAGIFTLAGSAGPEAEDPGFAQLNDIALLLHTSGSTSRPKLVPLTQANVCASARNVGAALQLTANDRCLNVMPLFHVHGLIGSVFSSLESGGSVVCTPDFYAPRFFEWMREFRPTWYTAVPTIHQAILRRAPLNRKAISLCPMRFIRSSSAPLPTQLMAELERVFGAPVIESYGMTEAAHQVTSNPLPPLGRKVGSVGVAAGPEVAIMEERGDLLPRGLTGEVVIRGTNVTRGYENNPAANAKALTYGWLRTGDLGFLDSDGYLFITGRLKEIINRGGEKISPGEIEETLMDHPAIMQAAAFAVPDAQLGEDVTAAVVLQEDMSATEREVREFASTRLADFKVPSHVVVVDELPKGATGKLQRAGLAEKLGLAPTPQGLPETPGEYVGPRTPTEKLLADIWAQVLGLEQIGIYDDFLSLGGDSILAGQVIARVCAATGAELSFLDLFDAPTVAGMASIVGTAGPSEGGLQPYSSLSASRERTPTLSYAQQRLWFLDQMEPGSPIYNVSSAVRMAGDLDTEALQRSLDAIVCRHEALRTTLSTVDGNPVQIIAQSQTVDLPVVDLSGHPGGEREERARELAEEEARRPFNLAQGPLFRTTLVKLGQEEHLLLLNVHHTVSDGWSMGILYRELGELYDAFSTGKPSPLPELPIRYADFSQWQRQWLQGEVLERQLTYWKQQVGDSPPALQLSTDHPRPAVPSSRGARQSLTLPKDLADSLKALSRREGVTLFMTLLAAYQTMLYRYTGQDDVVVGSPIAGRSRVETETLIGLFVNTLVLRTDLSGNPSFRELMGRVRKVALGAYSHQDLPFEKLVEELQPDRYTSRSPLFQVMFALQNVPNPDLQLPGLTLTSSEVDSGTAKFDLNLSMSETEQGLAGRVEYNTDLFDDATISRMMGHFQRLLEAIVAEPDQRLSDLPLLTEAERHQILVEWNDTNGEYPRDSCVHQLFEAQVERTPDAVALVFQDQQLTYRELNSRANQLAHHLISMGVGPEVLVGICVERSLEMVVGLLGILKAGGAYVPLDPTYPNERLAFMLEDTQAPVLLTQQRLMERLPPHGAKVVCLDAKWEVIAGESQENPISGTTASHLAYVMYTSGSTGEPKGISVPHRAINRLVFNTNYVELGPSDRVAQASNFSFDAATFEIWGALLHGARLVGITKDVALSPRDFAEQIRRHGVSVLFLTTALFNQLAREVPWAFKSLSHLLFGGEAVDPRWVREVLENDPPTRLLHVYGPTESTTFASWHLVQGVPEAATTIPIGRPISNTRIHLLDDNLKPVPIGVPGEICIGGDGLARGYLNDPKQTVEKFIPDPFSDETGDRLYKTGDLARYLLDGNIEFLGRIDDQVKVRGFRIEPGEIEAVLGQHPAIREIAVLAREDVPGDKRLVAYVTSKQEQAPNANELRTFLKEKLPDYMTPSAFVVLDTLPLTPNGKVDRQSLGMPDGSRPEQGHALVGPRSPVEEVLAGIWAELLRIDQLGIHDNFFELGGHSLLATQLISRVREAFQVDLPLRSLFEAPTVAGLAESIDADLRPGKGFEVPQILRNPRVGDLLTSLSQESLWFLDQWAPGLSTYNIPLVIRLTGLLDVAMLERSLDEIVARHEPLRTTLPSEKGQPIQAIASTMTLTFPLVDLMEFPVGEREERAQKLADEEARRPFNLAQGPLIRATLLKLEAEEHLLLLTVHHIVFDGWSMGILYRELGELYEAFSTGKPSPLPELPIRYADFSQWQRQWLQGEVLDRQLSYWKQQIGGSPPALELPTDRPRPPVLTYRGKIQLAELPKTLSQSLQRLSRQEGVTLFMTLLAAYQTMLYRYTGQDDVVVGSPIAGRSRVETEGLIGLFVNTLVLRTDLSGNPSFRELMGRVREMALGAYAHQDLPFEKLVEELQPERDLSRNPLFQVMFVLQNTPGSGMSLPGLALTDAEGDNGAAKVDLTLSLTETEQGLSERVEYSTDLFDDATITRMMGHFKRLLEAIVADPDQRLSDLPLLTEAERHQILVEWNDTNSEYPRDSCVHQLFEAQVERTPDAVALVFQDQQLTYRELNSRANQLAHHLISMGVGPEVLVGICVERSLEMVVGLLGILKAGGAYVPLDPSYPKERLAYMLEDTAAPVLLTQKRLVELFPDHSDKLVCLDSTSEMFAHASSENPLTDTSPDHPAYVIYTSGSTGRPKGVIGLHRGATNRLTWMLKTCPFEPGEVSCQKTSMSFVDSFCEIFGPLLQGIRTVVIPDDVLHDPRRLLETLASHEVTRIVLVPSLLRAILDTGVDVGRRLPQLQVWITSGEALSRELCQRFKEMFPERVLLNLYGSSEVTADVTYYNTGHISEDLMTVPIGRPIANTQVYLLDDNLQPVPVGVPGELCIAGDGLARGYLRQPELTAEKFIPNPFTTDPGTRLYKTGDLARYLPDGNIEFLGRIDNQVKIRGFRIELGEIEEVLGQHPSVAEALAAVREDQPGDQRLVAYVVPDQRQMTDSTDLRSFLDERLPRYMLPSAFVILETLPLTPNGKVDRLALPAPDGRSPEPEGALSRPPTPMESLIAEIWGEVLGLDQVGMYDNFFDLGGHSLLSMKAIARLEEVTGLGIGPRAMVFQTLVQLAADCEERLRLCQKSSPTGLTRKLISAAKSVLARSIP